MGVKPVGAMDWFGAGHVRQVAVGARGVGRQAAGGRQQQVLRDQLREGRRAAPRPDPRPLRRAQARRLRQALEDRADRRAGQGRPLHDAVARHDARGRQGGRPRRGGREADQGDRGALRGVPQGASRGGQGDRARGRRRHGAEELLPLQLQGPARPVPGRARLPAVGARSTSSPARRSAPRSPRSASTCSTSTGCSCSSTRPPASGSTGTSCSAGSTSRARGA